MKTTLGRCRATLVLPDCRMQPSRRPSRSDAVEREIGVVDDAVEVAF